jgi:hypothetical protein
MNTSILEVCLAIKAAASKEERTNDRALDSSHLSIGAPW